MLRNGTKQDLKLRSAEKSLAFYKFVMDSVPSGVITVDRDLKITGFNPWAERLIGYRSEEAIGHFCGEILRGGMCDTHCPLRTALTSQEPMSLVESTVQNKKGENENALPPIKADATQLRRVFTNLIDNAVKFSQRDGRIVVSTMHDKNEIRISVRDQGAGIAVEELPRIFDAFHRGKVGAKVEGFGLGLAAVKTIVEAHGGRVLVESGMGIGSTFTVILPRSSPHDTDPS